MKNLLVVETDSGHVFIGDTLVHVTIPQLKTEIDMDYEPNAITNSVVEAYIISFECEAKRMIHMYSTFNINELIEFF